MEMSPEQIIIVGLIASLLSVVVKLVSAKLGKQLSKFWMTIVVGVISLILAVVFNLPQLPEYIDPLSYLASWLALLSGYVGAATIVYNLLIDKILDAANLTAERFLP
jgi:uncharacterized membrane protein YdcZ (DUF606 family)